MIRFTQMLLLTICAAVLLPTLPAQRWNNGGGRGWQYLGQANVDGGRDHDRIRVDDREGMFRRLQLRVQRAPIDFDRVVVRFGNGQREEIGVRERIGAGGRTRAIDVPGDRRNIEEVEIWYGRAVAGSRRPRLELYGHR
jgi:hypothetical protein